MKLELPDNNASVLFHMGNALQSIARDIDTSLPVNGHKTTHTETVGDVSCTIANEPSDTVEDVTNAVRAALEALLGRCRQQTTEDLNTTDTEQYGKSVLGDCLDSIDNMIDAIAAEHEIPVNRLLGESDTIDADGLPWDQRINSKGRTRTKGDVWRVRQKPNDQTDEEWAEYVESVKTELRALMAIPVTVTHDPNEADPFAADVNGVEFRQLPGTIHNAEINYTIELPPVVHGVNVCFNSLSVVTPPVVDVVVTPPVVDDVVTPPVVDDVVTPPVVDAVVTPPVVDAVVTPPVVDAVVTPPVVDAVVTPPVVDAVVTPPPADFGALMRFITANKAKLTSPAVDDVLAGQGLASLALLATRPELIPQFHAALVKLL